ncbi:MAG: hypothetical protein ACKOEC_14675 [Acidimicrobiia bacterium]
MEKKSIASAGIKRADAKFKALEGVYNRLTAMTALSETKFIVLAFYYLAS